jgi:hypothetical protein
MSERFLFPDDVADTNSLGDRERAPKRVFVNTTPDQFQAIIDKAIAEGRYTPNKPDQHTCEFCGAPMPCIHSKSRQEGKALCQQCAAFKDGCDCSGCERLRNERKEAQRLADEQAAEIEELEALAARDKEPF